jgi:peptidoglycan/xylan/chitin deacetylase (PgdA/CDA1 family)
MKIDNYCRHTHAWIKFLVIGVIVFLGLTYFELLSATPDIEVPILGFHGVYNSHPVESQSSQQKVLSTDYSQQKLENFLDYLVKRNYWTLTTHELYENFILNPDRLISLKHLNQTPIVLSFDDGYNSIYTNLLPILEKIHLKYHRKIKVTLFVNSGLLGTHQGQIDYMSCEELKDGFKKGYFDVQSHTVNHWNLTQLTERELDYQFSQDQINLRQCIGNLDTKQTVAFHVAYPYGADNPLVDQYAARYFLSGYLYNNAVFMVTHPLKSNFGIEINRYRIPRLIVSQHKSVEDLKNLTSR